MPRLSPFTVEALRASVRPEYGGMEAADLEQLVEDAVSELSADTAENVWGALGSVGKAVGPTLQRAAPSMVQGAATGASVGGPWGALIGAGAGLASTALSGKPKPAATAGPTKPALAQTPALPSGQGAAATALSMMQNPTVQQALLSQVLGSTGRQNVVAPSGAQIPRGAINNLLMQLLASASESLDESESVDEQSYLRGEDGEYAVDPASPEQQAAAVLAHLASAPESMPADYAVEWIGEDLPPSGEDLEFADQVETMEFESVEFY